MQIKMQVQETISIYLRFLTCASFGIMLGWPSPTFPKLLSSEAKIRINLDQSALIAGMLMHGYAVIYALLMHFNEINFISSKHGLIVASFIIFCGWIKLYFASGVLFICIGRFIIGVGSGFGIAMFKFYIKEAIKPEIRNTISRWVPAFVASGMIIPYFVAPFISFRQFTIIPAGVAAVSAFVSTLIPESPKYLLIKEQKEKAENVIRKINDLQYIEEGLNNIRSILTEECLNIFQVFKCKSERKNFFILTLLMTVQQFTGGPGVNVYSQIYFSECGYLHPSFLSMGYITLFFISTCVAIKCINNLNRKPLLVISLIGTISASLGNVIYFYFKPNTIYFNLIPVATMTFYVICHTVGLTLMPHLIMGDLCAENTRPVMNCYVQLYTAELAVFITKIFQVLYATYDMSVVFAFFTCVGLCGLLLIVCFFKETKSCAGSN